MSEAAEGALQRRVRSSDKQPMAGVGGRWSTEEMRERLAEAARASGIIVRDAPKPTPTLEESLLDCGPNRAREDDARLVSIETEGLVSTSSTQPLSDDAPRPVGVQLGVLALVLWLNAIGPIWRLLTPPNFYGIPAPQLLAVLFAGGILWVLVLIVWGRVLPPFLRIFLRHRLNEWKGWLLLVIVFLVARSQGR